MRRTGEQRGAVRNHRRNLSGDRKQPYEFPIDPGQRVLEQRNDRYTNRIRAPFLHPPRRMKDGDTKSLGVSMLEPA